MGRSTASSSNTCREAPTRPSAVSSDAGMQSGAMVSGGLRSEGPGGGIAAEESRQARLEEAVEALGCHFDLQLAVGVALDVE
jgi:hypothetical protein